MADPPDFEGHGGRECGEHRTTGGRAWCYDCQAWCYPGGPCPRCELPQFRRDLNGRDAEIQRLRDELHRQRNETFHGELHDNRRARKVAEQVLGTEPNAEPFGVLVHQLAGLRASMTDQRAALWELLKRAVRELSARTATEARMWEIEAKRQGAELNQARSDLAAVLRQRDDAEARLMELQGSNAEEDPR